MCGENLTCKFGCKTTLRYYRLALVPHYAPTLYCLQGMTTHTALILSADLIFTAQKLRCLYLIISRVVNPKDIVVDNKFIFEAMYVIFSAHSIVEKTQLRRRIEKFLDERIVEDVEIFFGTGAIVELKKNDFDENDFDD